MNKLKSLMVVILVLLISLIISCKKEEEVIPVANYYIHHYFQNIENDDYTLLEEDDDVLEGVLEEMAVSFFMEYKGFTISKVDMQKLFDGETVDVNVYYDRNIINLTFLLEGGVTETKLTENQITGKYDDFFIIYDPEKVGYEFDGWSDPVPETFPEEDHVYKAIWVPLGTTEYKVEHYKQNIEDDEYTLVENDTEIFQGFTDTPTYAQPNIYKGFSVKEFKQQNIEGDGSTIVRIYYDRYISTLTFELNGGTTSTVLQGGALHGRYGDTVIIDDPVITGYEFIGWSYEVPETFPEYDYTFEALFSSNQYTKYKVEHWQQDIYDDYYSLEETDIEYGATDSYTFAIPKDYEGFTVKDFEQQIIKSYDEDDIITTIKIYYDRNISVFEFELNGGYTASTLYNNSLSGRYGAHIDMVDPVKTGYLFKSWSQNLPEEFPNYSARLEAYWQPITNTGYKVEHYKQNINNDEFTLSDTDYLYGTTDTNTYAIARDYPDFKVQKFNQKNINGDNSTIVKIYYDRIISTMSFVLDGGSCSSLLGRTEIIGKAGTPITIVDPVRENYSFIKWSPEIPDDIPDHNVTYTAIWHYMPLVVYVVNEDINVDYTVSENIITVTADDRYSNYKWYVEEKSYINENGNSIQIDTTQWCKGIYNIICSAIQNGILYYSNIQVNKGGN